MSSNAANLQPKQGTESKPGRTNARRVAAASGAAAVVVATAAGCALSSPTAENRQSVVNDLCNVINLGNGPCDVNTGVVSKVNADGTITYDMCAPGNPQLDQGRVPVAYFKRYTLAQVIKASGGQSVCHMTLGSSGDLSAPKALEMCKDNGIAEARNCAGAILNLENPGNVTNGYEWEYAGKLKLGDLSSNDKSVNPTTTSAPHGSGGGSGSGGSSHSGGGSGSGPTKTIFAVETNDSPAGSTLEWCFGDDTNPSALTSASQAESKGMGAVSNMMPSDKLDGFPCQVSADNMETNTAYDSAFGNKVGAVFEITIDQQGNFQSAPQLLAGAGAVH